MVEPVAAKRSTAGSADERSTRHRLRRAALRAPGPVTATRDGGHRERRLRHERLFSQTLPRAIRISIEKDRVEEPLEMRTRLHRQPARDEEGTRFPQCSELPVDHGPESTTECCKSCRRVRLGGGDWSSTTPPVVDAPTSDSVEQAVRQTLCRDCLTLQFPEYFAPLSTESSNSAERVVRDR